MTSESKSVLQFHDYCVEDMQFKRNLNYNSDIEEISIAYNFNAKISVPEEKQDIADILITCDIFDKEFKENSAPFFLSITLRGFFECTEGVNIEDFQINAVAILLPYLRATITSFTAQAGIAPVIIPPINVYKLINKDNKAESE